MGVDCNTYLPDNVRVRDVANVIAIAAGCGCQVTRLGSGGSYVKTNVVVETTSIPEMALIKFGDRYCYYFFEAEQGGRLISARSTPFWIAVSKRVVDIFGGRVDFNDCDDNEYDYSRPFGTDEENRPSDGDAWKDLQERIQCVLPVHISEMDDSNDGYSYSYDHNGDMTREVF